MVFISSVKIFLQLILKWEHVDLPKSIVKISELKCNSYISNSFGNKMEAGDFVHTFLMCREQLNSEVIQSMSYLSY